jgi:hypothetical protein
MQITSFIMSCFPTGFKNVYNQQILKPAYPMAFFYVKVHNPPSVGENSSQVEPDQEFVYVCQSFSCIKMLVSLIHIMQLHRRWLCHNRCFPREDKTRLPEDRRRRRERCSGRDDSKHYVQPMRSMHTQPDTRQESRSNLGGTCNSIYIVAVTGIIRI